MTAASQYLYFRNWRDAVDVRRLPDLHSVKQFYSVQDSNKKDIQFNMSGKLVTNKQNMEIYAPMQYSCYEHFVGLHIHIYCTVTLIVIDFFSIVANLKEMRKVLLCMRVVTRNMAEAFCSVNIGTVQTYSTAGCHVSYYSNLNTVIFGSNVLAIIDIKKGIKQRTMGKSFKCHLTRPLHELEVHFSRSFIYIVGIWQWAGMISRQL